MTPEIDAAFESIKQRFGSSALARVEKMMLPRGVARHPLQKQSKWIMPEISNKPWHDPYEYESIKKIAKELENNHEAIKAEISGVQSGAALENYGHYLGSQDNWKALYLFKDGKFQTQNQALVPTTFRVLNESIGASLCPLLEMHFSILHPGAEIQPHCDLWNFTINLHFAVDIPPGCAIKVADEVREWQEGKCLLFDYSYLHSAWNRGDRKRICLLVDLWNPNVTEPEREGLTVLITEIRKMMA